MRKLFDEYKNDDELKKLREELETLKEQFRKISGEGIAQAEFAPKEWVEAPIEGPEEPEEVLEPENVEVAEPEEIFPTREAEGEKRQDLHHGRREYDFRFDWGDRLGDYISGFVEDVMEGVANEIEKALFVRPHGRMVVHRKKPRRLTKINEKRTASIMSALGNEHRLKILDALSSGGLYASDLQEILKEISPSTLSSHLDVLEEAGLILQEKRRGRYLITIPGRLAIKIAYQIARRISTEPPDL